MWALVVPQALGYATVVGVPAQYGLYTILGASVLYAIFASTRQVVTGPSASVAAVTAPVAALYVASTSPEYLPTVIALTLCVGVVYALLALAVFGLVLTGMLPWQLFSAALNESGGATLLTGTFTAGSLPLFATPAVTVIRSWPEN